MTIEEIQNQIVDEFSMYDDWMDKIMTYLIEIGNGLSAMDETHKTEDNLIKGCQSRYGFMPNYGRVSCILKPIVMPLSRRYCRVIDPGILRSDTSRHCEC